MKKNRISIIIIILLFTFIFINCNCIIDPVINGVIKPNQEPEYYFEVLRYAILNDKIERFYFLLADEIREEFSFYYISSAWEKIKQEIKLNPEEVELFNVEYYRFSPFPPAPAACLTIKYPNKKGIIQTEKLLFVRQFSEGLKGWIWRIYYPYKPFQGKDIHEFIN